MAKSSKQKTETNESDQVAEATEASEIAPEEVTEDAVTDQEPAEDEAPDEDIADAEIVEEVEEQPVAAEEIEAIEMPQPMTSSRQRGVIPLIFGGLVAGGIGFAASAWMNAQDSGPDTAALIDAQAARVDALTTRLNELPETPDLGPIEARITALETSFDDRLAGMQSAIDDTIAALDDRLSDVEKRPGSDGTLSDSALEAYQRELDELRAQLEEQSGSVAQMAAQAEADLAAARAEAEQAEIDALVAARTANARAALNRISVAVDSGEGFAGQLPDLEVVLDVLPATLTDAAETGVPSLATLQAEFAPAARSALAAARAEGVAEDSGGLGGFLRSQFDVRSTAPREGTDPDAILSRAEAALKEGRLSDSLAEIAALPEVARAEMTDWTAQAQARADVLSAITTLSENLNAN